MPYIIGIDLGTTNSSVAVYRNNKAEIIANKLGSRITSSYVGFHNSDILVGKSAERQSSRLGKNLVYRHGHEHSGYRNSALQISKGFIILTEIKRIIGRAFDEKTVQNDIKLWGFDVVEENNKPMIKVEVGDEIKCLSPEEISAEVLRFLKESAEAFFYQKITQCVIAIPTHFYNDQRKATVEAAKIAGLEVLSLINEPVAAGVAYSIDKKRKKTNLFFDLGGGTFDVTVIKIDPKSKFKILATGGDPHLGGNDFTKLIYDYIIEKSNVEDCTLTTDKESVKRLFDACENAKLILTDGYDADVVVPAVFGKDKIDVNIVRAKFEELAHDLFAKTIEIVRSVLKDAKITKRNIDNVILVGGSSRIPKIHELLKKDFGDKILQNINPDEVVAEGAAVQAFLLSKDCPRSMKKIQLMDVTSVSLGIELRDSDMSVVVPKNSRMPARFWHNFLTLRDNQSSVRVKVYEGEKPKTKDNHFLGSFKLMDIPPLPKGKIAIKVCFDISADGKLNVSAYDKATKQTNKITITNIEGREEEPRQNKAEEAEPAEKIKTDQKHTKMLNDLKEFIRNSKASADSLCEKKTISNEDKDNIQNACKETEEWITKNKDDAGMDTVKIRDETRKLESVCHPVFGKAYK